MFGLGGQEILILVLLVAAIGVFVVRLNRKPKPPDDGDDRTW